MKILVKLFLGLILALMLGFFGKWGYKYYICQSPKAHLDSNYETYLAQCASEAKEYAHARGLNNHYCLLLDYGIPSGTPRLYVWSFDTEEVVARTYVMHGPGKGSTAEKPVFSNMPGSKCSALGHFAVTRHHGTKLKRSFRLRGLDIANKTAYYRGLMIHRSKWVDTNCWRDYIPLHPISCEGCVTVSSKGMTYLEKLINSQKKQLLLWSFDSKGQ